MIASSARQGTSSRSGTSTRFESGYSVGHEVPIGHETLHRFSNAGSVDVTGRQNPRTLDATLARFDPRAFRVFCSNLV